MVCFLVLLISMFLLGITPVYNAIQTTAWIYSSTGVLDFSYVESGYIENFAGKEHFLALNGILQNIIQAREVNERYKQDNGRLTYVIGEYDMDVIAANTVAFRDAVEEQGIPMVYVNTPFQIHETDTQLPIGIEDYSNDNADRFLAYLEKNQVSVLDLRDCVAEDGLDHYDLYFKTDHHWKPEAGLWAVGKITDYLARLDKSFGVDRSILDQENYHFETMEKVFLGSSGRRVGTTYAGMDDLTVITPEFDTNLIFSAPNGNLHRTGSFAETFLFPENLIADNILYSNSYTVYCGGSYDLLNIQNLGTESNANLNPKKILLIRDSYSDVLIPFLSLVYSQIHVIDMRVFTSDLLAYLDEFRPDLVLVVYNPGAYENNNLNMFDFLK